MVHYSSIYFSLNNVFNIYKDLIFYAFFLTRKKVDLYIKDL